MSHDVDIAALRKEYSRASLDERDVERDPLSQFRAWFGEAVKAELVEPNTMVLATASRDGSPSARAVLLKEFDEQGFIFYTNYLSRKAKDFEANPKAALLFYWAELERQVRIEGVVEKVSRSQSESYFCSRPRSAQIGALASEQSASIASRKELQDRALLFEEKYRDADVPCPENWGGYRVIPSRYEFWQGRESRLHDRICYTRSGALWNICRLCP